MKLSIAQIKDLLWFGSHGGTILSAFADSNNLRQLALVRRVRKGFGNRWQCELTKQGHDEYIKLRNRYNCDNCFELKERNIELRDCKICGGKGYIVDES